MCTRTSIRTIHGLEFETTQLSGDDYESCFFSLDQAREFAARLEDEEVNDLPEPQVYTHPTTGGEVLEVWDDYYLSTIFHLNSHGLFDVSDLSWED